MTAKVSVLHDYKMGKSFTLNLQTVGLTSYFVCGGGREGEIGSFSLGYSLVLLTTQKVPQLIPKSSVGCQPHSRQGSAGITHCSQGELTRLRGRARLMLGRQQFSPDPPKESNDRDGRKVALMETQVTVHPENSCRTLRLSKALRSRSSAFPLLVILALSLTTSMITNVT